MRVLFVLVFTFLSSFAHADRSQMRALWEVMMMDEFVEIISYEGREDGAELGELMISGSGGTVWKQQLLGIYDPERMTEILQNALLDEISRRDIDGSIAFYGTELGQRSLELELSARQALGDKALEEASKEIVAELDASNHERLKQIDSYIAANNLIEMNVVGAMNGNFAFLSALAEAGQSPISGSSEEILRQVWSQEEEIRSDTIDWARSYFVLSFQSLSHEEVDQLIAFSESIDGQRINSVLLGAFDRLFVQLAADLGTAIAPLMIGEEL